MYSKDDYLLTSTIDESYEVGSGYISPKKITARIQNQYDTLPENTGKVITSK